MKARMNWSTGLLGQRWAVSFLRKAVRLGCAALLGLGLIGTAQAAISSSERAVLLNLYNSTNGANWTNKTGWNGAVGTECSWVGVGCDGAQSHVTNIELPGNNLTGSLPSLSGLTALQLFNISDNQLTGAIPSLNGLTALRYFYAYINQLTGPIPSLSGLTALQSFQGYLNQLTGSIPSLSGLTALQDFNVSENQLTGSIPSLGGLTDLKFFHAYINQLTGAIPSLSGLTALQGFKAYNNQLTGAIPPLSGLTALKYIWVANNQLTGAIPAAPPSLDAGNTYLCNNQLQSSGSAAIDAAWTTATGTNWLACQTVTAARYNKIANNGSVLPDTAVLGSGAGDWACTRDNTSGLTWEVKTADGGLRDMNRLYTNYDDPTQPQKWENGVAINPTQAEIDAASNSIGLVNAVNTNASALCGTRDWKMPSKDELLSIVDTAYSPTISPTYFPNTSSSYFWSGSPYAGNSNDALDVFFYGGAVFNHARYYDNQVRLVRGRQSIGSFGLTLSATGTGSGTLTGSPGSLNCSSAAGTSTGTCSASLASGTSVTLTATPASGSTFTGWSGACSGTSTTCTVIMAAAKSVTAAFAGTGQAGIPASERAVLLNLYNSTNGANWTNKTGWNGAAGTECSWFGVTCDGAQNHVTHVNLIQNNLTGTIPSLSGLTALQEFYVDNNQLTGSIPSLSGLTALHSFGVSGNQLTGSISSLSGLTALQYFWGNDNQLTGSIPSLSGLTALKHFYAHNNQLTGSIPSLSGLTALQYFNASINQLTGPIPSLNGLTALVRFYAQSNQLTGPIPSLSGLTDLLSFHVDNNQLTGAIPAASPSMFASQSTLCNNQLQSSGNAAIDAAWTTATGVDWLACQTVTAARYSKIANNGSVLPDTAVLGSGAGDWACTRDNTTGLVWEVKTTDGGLRDWNKTYTNYDDPTQTQKLGVYGWLNPTQAEIDAASNSIGLANAVNGMALCGTNTWRIPSTDELLSIVDRSYLPTINSVFFPNTVSSDYWSSTPLDYTYYVRPVNFSDGLVGNSYYPRNYESSVRLVRGGQSIGTFGLTLSATGTGSGTLTGSPGSLNCSSAAGTSTGTCSASLASGTSVTLTATPASGSTFTGWSGACSGTSTTCTVIMAAAKSVTAAFAASTARYSKIANNGSVLPDSATLGTGATQWACTRDNTTGLVWEVKTTDGGVRDWSKNYTNYDDPTQAQKGNGSANPTQAEIDAASNSIGLVNAVNASALCGTRDWKMPSKDELLSIVDTSYSPTISPTYFPNTASPGYWSGSPVDGYSSHAWGVGFVSGGVGGNPRSFVLKIRLVRGGQSIGTFGLTLSATGTGSGTLTGSPGSLNCSSVAGTSTGTCSASLASGTSVTLTATPASGSTFTGWSGACSGTSTTCTVIMAAAKSVTAAFAASTARYSKIANNGSVLPDSATLGTGATQWACTRDNTTGLVWEVKTTDGGLRDWSKTYTNYDDPTQAQKRENGVGINPTQAEIDAASNSIGLVNAVNTNASALCGTRDWKRPSKDELLSIVDTSYSPTISPTYFPNTWSSYFWSGSSNLYSSDYAWDVNFYAGFVGDDNRSDDNRVRLVRGGQSIGSFGLTLSATGIGSGTLTGSPGSLNCISAAGTSTGTCSASLASGTSVTLTAKPASGSTFTGWSGACSGTSTTCTVIMAAAKSITANFNSAGQARQTITFGSTPTVTVGGTGTVSATASSGLAVTFSSSTPGTCSLSGTTVSGIAVGICTLAANQAGNSSFSPAAQVTLSFSIAAAPLPPGSPTIVSITAGHGSATLNFSAPSNTGGSAITGYTASCTASGQTPRTATGTASPLTVRNLSGAVLYQCTLTATNSGGLTSVASVAQPVIPAAGKSSLTPMLMLLLN